MVIDWELRLEKKSINKSDIEKVVELLQSLLANFILKYISNPGQPMIHASISAFIHTILTISPFRYVYMLQVSWSFYMYEYDYSIAAPIISLLQECCVFDHISI